MVEIEQLLDYSPETVVCSHGKKMLIGKLHISEYDDLSNYTFIIRVKTDKWMEVNEYPVGDIRLALKEYNNIQV